MFNPKLPRQPLLSRVRMRLLYLWKLWRPWDLLRGPQSRSRVVEERFRRWQVEERAALNLSPLPAPSSLDPKPPPKL